MATTSGYEFFEHTADTGIRASGRTLGELFANMARGLTELLVENSEIPPETTRSIELQADDAEMLLLAWLQELLFWFATERFAAIEYQIDQVTPTALRGEVRGGRFDPARHTPGREVKAITRHELRVVQGADGWTAEVIVDI